MAMHLTLRYFETIAGIGRPRDDGSPGRMLAAVAVAEARILLGTLYRVSNGAAEASARNSRTVQAESPEKNSTVPVSIEYSAPTTIS